MADEISREELEKLINYQSGPALSIYMPTSRRGGEAVNKMFIKFKNLFSKAKDRLTKNYNISAKKRDKIFLPLERLKKDRNFWLHQSRGLVIFASPELFKTYRLPIKFNEEISVEKYFNIKQILPSIFENKNYYVLALSKNKNRFFQCTVDDIELIEREELPDGIEETLQYDDPEKSIQYHSGSGNKTSAIYHGQGVTEQNEEDILRYLREVEEVITGYLRGKKAPLLLMCVKRIYALYKDINNYSNLIEDYVSGNPDHKNEEDILKETRELVLPYVENQWKKAVEKYNKLKTTEKTSNEIREVITNAYYGKVKYLLIKSDSDKKTGIYNPESNKIKKDDKNNYDLYNYSAINTIKHGGKVYLLDSRKMPGEFNIGAVYRY